MWDLTGVCLLFTCMTNSTARSDRFVFTIYMILYDRFHCEIWPVCLFDIRVWPNTEGCVIDPYTDILPCCHVITEASWWVRDYPQKSREKKTLSQNSSSNSSPLPCEENDCDKECYNLYNLSTTLLFWFISVCISIFLYTFQCSYKRIDILVCFWISFYVCHFSKR